MKRIAHFFGIHTWYYWDNVEYNRMNVQRTNWYTEYRKCDVCYKVEERQRMVGSGYKTGWSEPV